MTREDTFWKAIRWRPEARKNAQHPAGQSVWFMVCLCTWKSLVCAHQKGYVNVPTCQKMFCFQRWQLCPWCRCTFDFLAGPEVKSSTIKYFTNLGVQGNMKVITPPPPPEPQPHPKTWSGFFASVRTGTWITRTSSPGRIAPQDMIKVQCWCVQGNMNIITPPTPPTAPHPTLTPTCVGLVRADVCLWRA